MAIRELFISESCQSGVIVNDAKDRQAYFDRGYVECDSCGALYLPEGNA